MVIKVGLEDAPPLTAAGLRFIIASLVIFAIVRARRIEIPKTPAFRRLTLFLGVFQMAAPLSLVYFGEQYLSSGLTAILFATMPLMVATLARIFLGDPLTGRKILGIVIGFAGVYVIFAGSVSSGGRDSLYGIVAVLCAALLSSVTSIVTKRYSRPYNPFASAFPTVSYATVVIVACALLLERDMDINWTASFLTTVVYLAVLGSVVAYALYYWLIKHMDVTVMSYATFIIPILAAFMGWIFLGEKVTFQVTIGGGLILLGIALALFPRANIKRLTGARP